MVFQFPCGTFWMSRSPVDAGDRRRDADFIDENQPLQIKPWLLLLQDLTCGDDVRPVLLGGPQTLKRKFK
jgi:hypothetical protein